MDDVDLQSLQVAGKHPPLGIVQGGQVLRARLSEDPGGEGDKVATLVHRTDGRVAIEVQFP